MLKLKTMFVSGWTYLAIPLIGLSITLLLAIVAQTIPDGAYRTVLFLSIVVMIASLVYTLRQLKSREWAFIPSYRYAVFAAWLTAVGLAHDYRDTITDFAIDWNIPTAVTIPIVIFWIVVTVWASVAHVDTARRKIVYKMPVSLSSRNLFLAFSPIACWHLVLTNL